MTQETKEITLEIFGKPYLVKCTESERIGLERAAQFLNEQMVTLREKNHMLSSDKILVAASIHIAHQFLTLENQMLRQAEKFRELENTLDKALLPLRQMELEPAE